MGIRVAIQGMGNVGVPALRTVVAHPGLELSGCIVHSEAKDGRDAGELAGLAPLGVPATRDAARVLAQSDALVYAASQDFRPAEAQDEMCRALAGGVDVVTAGLYGLLHPPTAPGPLRERFAGACQEGGSRFLSSGIDPGFAMDLLPVALSGVCERIEEIRIVENFNYASYDVPPAVRRIIGFGSAMEETPAMLLPGVPRGVWGGSLHALAGALGFTLDAVRERIERHPLERDVTVGGETLRRGSQGAFRFEVLGMVGEQARLVVEHVTRIVDDTAPQWPRAEGMGHHQVLVRGRPDIRLTLECMGPGGDHVAGGNAAAAARLVHAIPWLAEAPPGLLSGADLPLIAGRGSFAAPPEREAISAP
ncbi:MAG: dihydrodipicolinate reductase [Myxococcales bacterium]|nr:dihydrodipicolinate reductase [Myxococcales bacterium]